ncbi:hypothetical protein GCM10007874_39090 [Labrys miyagiensis]|uniref:DUF4440 domain-containing protein n=1 Tax=Labrys miyagiensis TaxID=346912 RepID=A0ABQ6CRJ8_9HYPH|nr:DUF4440 domain-containing protein [Labrys miyagiensis]GLS20892.1 hypothetical protein GCM10007874_39090 [Labrys miyagiensis]
MTSPCAATPDEGPASVALLESLERQLLDPALRADAAGLAALLHDGFVEFGRSGAVYDKAGVIAALAAETSEPPGARLAQDFQIKPLSEAVALVTYVTIRRIEGAADLRSRRSSIWTLANGRWQMIFHQGTPIPPEVGVG